MRTTTAIIGASFLILVLLLLSGPRFARKRDAVLRVGATLLHSDYHQVPIVANGVSALRAQHNQGVIVEATEYMSAFESNTSVFREIAKVAASADHECPQLYSVLELAARMTSDSATIVALAERACRIQSSEDELAWRGLYDQVSELATFPSVEAALAAQGHE